MKQLQIVMERLKVMHTVNEMEVNEVEVNKVEVNEKEKLVKDVKRIRRLRSLKKQIEENRKKDK
jgi:hypothetical protein